MAQNLVDRALHLAAIARTQQRVHEDVVGLQHRVGFQLAAPVAVRMLLPEQPVLGAFDAVDHLVQADVDPAKARLCAGWLQRPANVLVIMFSSTDSIHCLSNLRTDR